MELNNSQKVTIRHLKDILNDWNKTKSFNHIDVQHDIIREGVAAANEECHLTKRNREELRIAMKVLLNALKRID